MTRVRVSIRRLAFDGFALDARQARTARRAVETELGRLLTENALPTALAEGGARARLSARPLEAGAWRDPRDLGSQVAHALYGGLGGAARTRRVK
jgi:DNA-binding GntR family transcriptional regulator